MTGDETWLHHFEPEKKAAISGMALCKLTLHPDLASCDHHLFGKLKESLRGTRFEPDDSLVNVAKYCLRLDSPGFDCAGMQAIVPR